MFRKCVALTLLLLMGVFPMKVLAQQSTTNNKAAADIAEVFDAQFAGERDARAKAQMERYFTLGACAGSCLTFVGCLISAAIADSVYPETERYHMSIKTKKRMPKYDCYPHPAFPNEPDFSVVTRGCFSGCPPNDNLSYFIGSIVLLDCADESVSTNTLVENPED